MSKSTISTFELFKMFPDAEAARVYMECKRCDELRGGAAPREGWGARAKAEEESRIRAIRAHDCRKAGCGPVCTAFDW